MKLIETMDEAIQFIECSDSENMDEPSDFHRVVLHNLMVIASVYGYDVRGKLKHSFSVGLSHTLNHVVRNLCENTPHYIINRERDVESIIRFVTDSPSNMQYVEDICNKDVMFISSNDGECDGVQFFVDVNEQIYELFEKYKHYDDVESILGRSSEIRIGVGNSYFIVLRPTDIDMAVVRRGVKCLRERGWLPFNCEKSFIVSALEDEVLTKAFNAVYDTKNRTTEHLTMFNCDILPSLLRRGKFKICPLDSERQIAKFNLLTGQSMNDKKNLVVVNYEFLKNVKE